MFPEAAAETFEITVSRSSYTPGKIQFRIGNTISGQNQGASEISLVEKVTNKVSSGYYFF